ncbi:hypothetical protein C8R44DRAFT_728511 [Mycena epipterygia]|nr:hypothetical protein C8R44DRAFT_728511 [Mycena epipterygia]
MPHPPTVQEIHLHNIISCLPPAVTLFNEVADALGTPFVQAISNTTLSLITAVKVGGKSNLDLQNLKRNKDESIALLENIYQILHGMINLHIKSDTAETLPPATLYHIGKFTEYSVMYTFADSFIEAQQDGNMLKRFLHHSEMNTLRRACHAGLEEALEVFTVESDLLATKNLVELQQTMEKMHQELLEFVTNLSNTSTSDRSSSDFARIAILGAGGIGKTSLAKAALHHPEIAAKYEHRFFIVVDSATSSIELAAVIGAHLGLKPGKDLTKPVIQYFSNTPSCLLVLDNLETPWEPLQSRGSVEELLSLITEITHLALIITMRGAERPSKVRWTRPFLEPLKPLSDEDARTIFIEIADDFHDSKDIDRLLHLTDNMPLAVELIAHLVNYEGSSKVLARWEKEKTSLFSIGYDKTSNLDASIAMSLASPRITSSARTLLSLLSILPDGLSDIELGQCKLPIQDPLGCRATLISTSLAYWDDKKRLKSLTPIREHVNHFYPPLPELVHPLCEYFHVLLDLYVKYRGIHQNNARMTQITSNLGNLQQLLLLELQPGNPELTEAVNCSLDLNSFCRVTGHHHIQLMDHIKTVLPQLCDHQVKARFILEMFATMDDPIVNPQFLIAECVTHFQHFNDPAFEASFNVMVGNYYFFSKNDISRSAHFFEKALSLAKSCGDSEQHCIALNRIAALKSAIGDHPASQRHSLEAQQIAQLSSNLYQQALAVRTQAICLLAVRNLKDSVCMYERARKLLKLCGMQGGNADRGIVGDLAEIHLLKSEYLEARNIHIEVAQEASSQHDQYFHGMALLNIAEIDVILGADMSEVQQNLENAKTKLRTFSRALSHCETISADLALREGNISVAEAQFQQFLKESWGKDPEAVSYCLERLSDIRRWPSSHRNRLSTWAVIYLLHAHKTHEKLALYKALHLLGVFFLSAGDKHTAHSLFILALEGFTYMDVHRSRGDCMLHLGDITKDRGDLLKAAELWKEAGPLFEKSLQMEDVSKIHSRLEYLYQETLEHLINRPSTESLEKSNINKPLSLLDIQTQDTMYKSQERSNVYLEQ